MVFIQEIIYLKDGACVINIDEYKSIGTHWIALYVNGDNVTYFDSFGVEHIPKEIKKFIGNKNIATNIYKHFCNRFIVIMLKDKSIRSYPFTFT